MSWKIEFTSCSHLSLFLDAFQQNIVSRNMINTLSNCFCDLSKSSTVIDHCLSLCNFQWRSFSPSCLLLVFFFLEMLYFQKPIPRPGHLVPLNCKAHFYNWVAKISILKWNALSISLWAFKSYNFIVKLSEMFLQICLIFFFQHCHAFYTPWSHSDICNQKSVCVRPPFLCLQDFWVNFLLLLLWYFASLAIKQ